MHERDCSVLFLDNESSQTPIIRKRAQQIIVDETIMLQVRILALEGPGSHDMIILANIDLPCETRTVQDF